MHVFGASNTRAPVTPATSSTQSYTNTDILTSTLLETHDTYRTAHNASSLIWNSTLATSARRHAQPCDFTHSKNIPFGENLAARYPNTTTAVEVWGNERKDYDFSDADFDDETGRFTQMVWKTTTCVGCGATWCDGENGTPQRYLMCQYLPAGNVKGAFRENVEEMTGNGARRTKIFGTRWLVMSAVITIVFGVCQHHSTQSYNPSHPDILKVALSPAQKHRFTQLESLPYAIEALPSPLRLAKEPERQIHSYTQTE
ncbi:MAG: hypothetical protein Q9198_003935 [Flavoplaca austrocitrina]